VFWPSNTSLNKVKSTVAKKSTHDSFCLLLSAVDCQWQLMPHIFSLTMREDPVHQVALLELRKMVSEIQYFILVLNYCQTIGMQLLFSLLSSAVNCHCQLTPLILSLTCKEKIWGVHCHLELIKWLVKCATYLKFKIVTHIISLFVCCKERLWSYHSISHQDVDRWVQHFHLFFNWRKHLLHLA
jgi:hypothetical protein